MYFRQKPSSWCSCSPAGACGSWCPAAAGKVLEASIREKVSLPILKGKVSLQSPNLATPKVFASPDSFGVCRSSVGRGTLPFGRSPNSNTQIFEVRPPPGARDGTRFEGITHAGDGGYSAALLRGCRPVGG